MKTDRTSDQFVMRMPDGMRPHLAEIAQANGRSMNAEVIHRLTQSLQETDPMPQASEGTSKSNAMTVRLSDEARARLEKLSQRGPYRISMTSIIERGIQLATEELERMSGEAGK